MDIKIAAATYQGINMSEVMRWIAAEVERQECGFEQVGDMYEAWEFAMALYINGRLIPEVQDANHIAFLVEKSRQLNHYHYLQEPPVNYRMTPATFKQGEPAIKATLIPRQMALLFSNVSDPHYRDYDDWLNEWTKQLLDIHPWCDGNGRTASILWNWLNGTLAMPLPLPYYYGDN